MRLEESQLADAFGADAAGGEVGDAAGVELDADVGDVDLAGEDGQANGMQGADRRAHQREDDVEVVDHEVKDDIDVQRAGAEDAEAMRLKEHGRVDAGLGGGDGRVEALEVARLQDARALCCEIDELRRLVGGGGEGLLDEQIESGVEELLGDFEVRRCGRADRGGVEAEVAAAARGEGFGDGREDRDAPFASSGAGARRIGLDDGGETNGGAVALERAVDTEM